MTEVFSPLVQDTTKSQSESIETVLARLKSGRVYIPDYQRDAEQWDARKKSLFIESILNNLTIPAFFFCEDENRNNEVVDGQQRLFTIWSFADKKISLTDGSKIDYIAPQSALYAGKNFGQINTTLQNIFNDYPLTIIYLPKSLGLQTKLEIFRRINEGGTPLSGQDIRLAYYIQSKSVTFIRLVGIYRNPDEPTEAFSDENDESDAKKPFQRVIDLAQNQGITLPWNRYPEARELWCNWWKEKEKSKGQTPSLMFLWYLVCLERNKLDDLLKNPKHLPISFNRSTETALDIYCAQLQYQEVDKGYRGINILSSFETISSDYFKGFATWIDSILSRNISGVSVDKYKQLALFIAGVVELGISPRTLSERQWSKASEFIHKPREVGKELLKDENGYPEPKGIWSGQKGQKQQCEKTVEIAKIIVNL